MAEGGPEGAVDWICLPTGCTQPRLRRCRLVADSVPDASTTSSFQSERVRGESGADDSLLYSGQYSESAARVKARCDEPGPETTQCAGVQD